MELDGKVALVFGGAQGIGRATAELLAARGARVTVADIAAEPAAATVDAIGARAAWVRTDATDGLDVDEALRATFAAWGGLDMVVHCIFRDEPRPLTEMEEPVWDATVRATLTSAYLVSRAAVPALQARGGGSLTFVSSIQARFGYPGESAYAAAKAGLGGLARQIAVEYGPLGIRANCVLPSLILTARERQRLEATPAKVDHLVRCFPLRRIGAPEEAAEAVAFLASERARFITGVELLVDGGIAAQPATHAGRHIKEIDA